MTRLPRNVRLTSAIVAIALAFAVYGVAESQTTPASSSTPETYNGRDMLVFVPPKLPAKGARALVIVLHGGLGNAASIENGAGETGLRMDAVASSDGFIVAYLNGTRVARLLGANRLGWNAGGGCCGVPAQDNVDDVGYISGAVSHLVTEYGIDPKRVYAIGHSNGAMMAMRLMCETTILAAAVSVAGPLNLPVAACPDARGHRILSIHGADDRNVPVDGGQGALSISRVTYVSEKATEQIFTSSGADFHVQIVPGADHFLGHIDDKIQEREGISLAEKSARFFGLSRTI